MLGVSKNEIIQRLSDIKPNGTIKIVKNSPIKEVKKKQVNLTKFPIMKIQKFVRCV